LTQIKKPRETRGDLAFLYVLRLIFLYQCLSVFICGSIEFSFWRVAGTLDDWQARIFREGRIYRRTLAQVKHRASRGFNLPRMQTVGAEPRMGPFPQHIVFFKHAS
jgi:hypothetical protein